MATAENSYLRTELVHRRELLHSVVHTGHSNESLTRLLSEVDAALARLDRGNFGVCEACQGKISTERLLSDPLASVCLDCLSQEEQHSLEVDLALAGRIQRGLLPSSGTCLGGWKFAYHYEPAGLVSGDYCDFIDTDRGLLFLLGDVSGKGVAASMLMSHLNATFRSLAAADLPLDRMVESANRIFCKSTLASQYATLVVGRAAPDGAVEFASAGHLPLLHLHERGASSYEATGVPLGMFCDAAFSVHRLSLQPGDTLFLHTDGLSEARNSGGEEFGLARVAAFLSGVDRTAPERILQDCVTEWRKHRGEQKASDDLTILTLCRAT